MFGYTLLAAAGILSFIGGFALMVVALPFAILSEWTAKRIDAYFERRVAKRGYRLR